MPFIWKDNHKMIAPKHGLSFRRALRAAPVLALWLPLACLPAFAEEQDKWSFDITPYLWVADVKAETSLPGVPPSTPPEATRFDTRLSGGALLGAQVRYRSVGLWADFAWLQLDSEANHPGPAFSAVNLKTDFIHGTAALTYRLPLQGKFHADVLAGARFWFVSERIEATTGTLPGFNAGGDNTWVDPIIGADLRYELSPRWALVTKGTVGGSSDLGWEVMSGASYRCSELCSVAFGYRFLHEEYARNRFTFNTDIQGFIVGVGFHF